MKGVQLNPFCRKIKKTCFFFFLKQQLYQLCSVKFHVRHKNNTGFAVNADECLMTKMQEMSFGYHFTVEQEVGSTAHAFFGFNGRLSTSKNNFKILLLLLPRT